MYQHVIQHDHETYRSAPAEFLIEAVRTLTGYDVAPDPDLTDRLVEISHREREVRIKTGLGLRKFHNLIGRTTLYVTGGALWAPEFESRPKLTVVRVD